MGGETGHKIEIVLDDETMKMLAACAEWRNVSVADLVKAYVEDWLDVDYPESQGRLTRRGIDRDGPLMLDPKTKRMTSRNWRRELGRE